MKKDLEKRKICFAVDSSSLLDERYFKEFLSQYEVYFISCEEEFKINLFERPYIILQNNFISNYRKVKSFLKNNDVKILCDLAKNKNSLLFLAALNANILKKVSVVLEDKIYSTTKLNKYIYSKLTDVFFVSNNIKISDFNQYYSKYISFNFNDCENSLIEKLINTFNKPLPDLKTNLNNPIIKWIWIHIKKYNHNKYWKRRFFVSNRNYKNKIKKYYYFIYIKKIDTKHLCSFGTEINGGANFKTPPILPHGPSGIIIGHDCIIGENSTIYHQVTIMHGNVVLGDNVTVGAGAKILPNVKIGNNCKIGANCIVTNDVPDNATVVMQKPRIIIK